MMNGVTVSYCNLPSETIKELTELVEKLGGRVLKDFDEGEVTHLITDECKSNSETYKHAREKHLPVVLPRWIRDASKAKMHDIMFPAQCDAVLNLYKTPIFQNCVITTSGFDPDCKNEIAKMIKSNGGTYSPPMSKSSCTHLVCHRNTGDKYATALKWNTIKIVTRAWIEECIKKGYRLPEENFGFDTNAHGSELDKIDESEDEETKGGEDKTKSNT